MVKVIKRDSREVDFDSVRIFTAVRQAFIEVDNFFSFNARKITEKIVNNISNKVNNSNQNISVEKIQDLVEDELMRSKRKDVARAYVRYRYKRELVRIGNTTDKSIHELLEGTNDYWNDENSNKNATLVTTQRDYIAGITSTDISKRFLLTSEIVDAHDKGIIHFHKNIVA